jgi:hypothetical protein
MQMPKPVMLVFVAMATKKKNAAAVALGRMGGLKKVPKGLAQLSAEQRSAIARKGAEKRWAKKKKAPGSAKAAAGKKEK